MTTQKVAAAPTGKLLYSGPAGEVRADSLKLYNLSAQGVTVQGVMAGGPGNQPTPQEIAALSSAAKNALGGIPPWALALAFMLAFVGLQASGAPGWAGWLLLLVGVLALVAWPVYRQYQAYQGMFGAREELTILLSDVPTQTVSSVIEVRPESRGQTIKPAQQPVALVVHGLPLPERIKLSGGVTRHVALGQMAARRKGAGKQG